MAVIHINTERADIYAEHLHSDEGYTVFLVGSWTKILSQNARLEVGRNYYDWAAYIGAGPSYADEKDVIGHILNHGTKVDPKIAEAVFGFIIERNNTPWRE